MTDEHLKRANEIKEEIRLCTDLLTDLNDPERGYDIVTIDEEGNPRKEGARVSSLLRPDLIELLRAKISALTFEFKGL